MLVPLTGVFQYAVWTLCFVKTLAKMETRLKEVLSPGAVIELHQGSEPPRWSLYGQPEPQYVVTPKMEEDVSAIVSLIHPVEALRPICLDSRYDFAMITVHPFWSPTAGMASPPRSILALLVS